MVYPSWIWYLLFVVASFFLNQVECVRNGELVEDVNKFKYIVGLQVQYYSRGHVSHVSLCGGGILDDYHILTAAHCLVNRSRTFEYPGKVKIRLHTLKNRDSMLQMKRYAQKLYFPEAYFRNTLDKGLLENDIAVIKVKQSMNLAGNSRKLQKLELPGPNSITDGDVGDFAGYGVYDFKRETDGTETQLSDYRLRTFHFQVVRNGQCSTSQLQDSKTRMCIRPYPIGGSTKQGSCYGDSGSPLAIKNHDGKLMVIGVCSSKEGNLIDDCDSRNARGFFTRVSVFDNWIRRAMNDAPDETDTTVIDMNYPTSCFW